MYLTITEIVSRSEQGMTRPFLCRAESDHLYYVKGRYAGFRSLCCEWVAGRLGKFLGLPIPEFCIAEVPRQLVVESSRSDVSELGAGPVFASLFVEDAQEFTFTDVQRIDLSLKQKVLLFDWWVRNDDRALTAFGGNPNLLCNAGSGALRVFDLNLAFDETFDEARFWRSHVFNGAVSAWSDEFRAQITSAMGSAVEQLPVIWAELPGDWLQAGGLDFDSIVKVLKRFESDPDDFWDIRR